MLSAAASTDLPAAGTNNPAGPSAAIHLTTDPTTTTTTAGAWDSSKFILQVYFTQNNIKDNFLKTSTIVRLTKYQSSNFCTCLCMCMQLCVCLDIWYKHTLGGGVEIIRERMPEFSQKSTLIIIKINQEVHKSLICMAKQPGNAMINLHKNQT